MKTKYIYTAITLLVLLTSCTIMGDDSPKLPRATQTGANTLGCIVNGAVYECSGHYDASAVLSFGGVDYGFYNTGFLNIDANCSSSNKHVPNGIFISFKFDGKPGIYKNIKGAKKGSDSYVKITRYSNGILSGTFQIIMEYDSGEIVHFTNGRFDILQD